MSPIGFTDSKILDQAVELAADLCRQFEGLRLKPYLCPAGIPTIGYGSTRYADGRAVTLRDAPIAREQADELLRLTLKRDYLPGLLAASPVLEQSPQALGALGSFAYNLGLGAYRASTLRKRVDAGDWAGVAVELAKWVRGGGKVLPGLVARREAEADLVKAV